METAVDKRFKIVNGIFVSVLSEMKFNDFEKQYLKVRKKEKRILGIDEIKQLPYVTKSNSDYRIWKIRQKSIHRFLNYIKKKKQPLRILDIGCGNGFFTNIVSKPNNTVVGLDVNLIELTQAINSFPSDKLKWYYLDILNEKLPEEDFDIIVFCASFQYFDNPVALLNVCKTLLKPGGEIHIVDSPFYSKTDKEKAQQRSSAYFKIMDEEPMSNYYHHNTYECLKEFDYSFKYKPNAFLSKLLPIKDSPFPWILIK